MKKFGSRIATALAIAWLAGGAIAALNLEGWTSSPPSRSLDYYLVDLGGVGNPALFVERETANGQCICPLAKAYATYGHAMVLRIGEGSQAGAVTALVADLMAGRTDGVVVATSETLSSCAACRSAPKVPLAVYDAGPALTLNAAPDMLARNIITYVATPFNVSSDVVHPHGGRWW